MKRGWLTLVLALVLLCKCEAPPDVESPPSDHISTETKPTESVGFYDPDSAPETAPLRTYPLGTEDAEAIAFLGTDLLLFSGGKNTTLTLLAAQTLTVKASAQLTCTVSLSDPGVAVTGQGITYVDHTARELVFLDRTLTETGRLKFPSDSGTVALSEDSRCLYYCSEDALRMLDLDTGLDRLIRQMYFPCQELTALHCSGTIVQCTVTYDDGTPYSLFFDTGNGKLLHESREDVPLWTHGSLYFTTHMDGAYQELISGSQHFGPSILVVPSGYTGILPVLSRQSLLLYRHSDTGSTTLDYYNLESGIRTAHAELPGSIHPVSIQPDPNENLLWLLYFDPELQQDVLCAWNPDSSPSEDAGQYLQNRWNREYPDLEGLVQCQTLADQISDRHHVRILLWAAAADCPPWDYTLVPEYQVPLIQERLQELDQALSCYPEGFLKEVAALTPSGRLHICLVREIYGNAEANALESADGLQYWDSNSDAYLAVTLENGMTRHFHHELFHVIESRVLGCCAAYDDWNSLNPPGFQYHQGDYSGITQRDLALISGSDRYFIDLYSMHYPKEDRARIMEYAMMSDQGALFQSEPMQAKLRQLCLGIRQTFPLNRDSCLWEQYLSEPIT